jgi:hypothetical protein
MLLTGIQLIWTVLSYFRMNSSVSVFFRLLVGLSGLWHRPRMRQTG